ncbi:MAG: hypothetical protein IJ058_11260 [Lachnospiraceae bacterium]|nr:hypothetical protein [Lachnospiraceae bacterium]
MCKALKEKETRDKISGFIEGMQTAGVNENDIITKAAEKFHVTKELVLSLVMPQKASKNVLLIEKQALL